MDADDKTIILEIMWWPFKSALHALLMATGLFQKQPEGKCPLCDHDAG